MAKATAAPPTKAAPLRIDGAKLLALRPDDLTSLLDRLRDQKSLRPMDKPALAAATACGWCTAEGTLTPAGQSLAGADRTGRATQLQVALRTDAAYQTAEQNLMQQGTLSLQQLQVLMAALPASLRKDPKTVLIWLRWVLQELHLGAPTAAGVAWNPTGRHRK